ncbi:MULTISPECIES: hypothetical protein [Dermabacter]|uniref:hypothetical protein n=1 Tax=Dermabacter TaxID=36739 RepID=UPI000772E671|nr:MULTISPECIES: hypothetical protein [Dermabacter]MCT1806515.1 hypothetical protein [Dermabacter hominis]MDU4693992.1 hypothetical protein [Dermabacter sp.]OFT21198.1 hypothetical protein HMPREF3176_03175 [Dermabacter sp. HMSC08H10]OFT45516.1 hypothetical protein HMPREF3157_09665 [Dermabacter sp. HMSC06F07]
MTSQTPHEPGNSRSSGTTGQQDIIIGVIVFLLGFLAIATAWGTISYMTALASWIAGIVLVMRGIRKHRGTPPQA